MKKNNTSWPHTIGTITRDAQFKQDVVLFALPHKSFCEWLFSFFFFFVELLIFCLLLWSHCSSAGSHRNPRNKVCNRIAMDRLFANMYDKNWSSDSMDGRIIKKSCIVASTTSKLGSVWRSPCLAVAESSLGNWSKPERRISVKH